MIQKQTTVDFADLFHWAGEAPRNVQWNHCCDIFHRTEIFNYRGHTPFYLEEIKADLADDEYWASHKQLKVDHWKEAYTLLVAFMEENKLDEMLVLGSNS